MEEVNKQLKSQANSVVQVLRSHAIAKEFRKSNLDDGTKDVLDKITKGVMSYDTALRLLSENKNVPRSIVEDFFSFLHLTYKYFQ